MFYLSLPPLLLLNYFMQFNNLLNSFNSFFSSTFALSPEDKRILLANHRRKYILASFSLSNKEKPSVFVSITGLPDSVDLNILLDNQFRSFWKSLNFISKHNNNYGNLYFDDLIGNNSSNINVYNLELEQILVSFKNKDKHEKVVKDAFNHSLFVFEGYDWFEIISQFKFHGVEISGGIGTKRHILSPNEYRLLLALLPLGFNLNLLGYYYHYTSYLSSSFKGDYHYNNESSFTNENYENSNNDDYNRSYHTTSDTNNLGLSSNSFTRKITLPFNFNKRRLYSTGSIIQPKSIYFEYSPIYLNIKDIINSTISPMLKQEKIEQLLNDTWYNIYLNKLENMNAHSSDHIKLLQTHILEFRESFSNYLTNLKNLDNEKCFKPLLYSSVDDISSCVFKVLFPIIFKGEDVNKTNTIIEIGKCVFNKWVKLEYPKYKENHENIMKFTEYKESDHMMKFSEYKESLDFSDRDFLLLGDFLFNIVYETSNIFDIQVDNSESKNTKLFISPVQRVKKAFERNLEVLGFKLPMLCSPVDWRPEVNGGYLFNDSIYNNSLIIPSKKSTLNTIIDNVIVYNSINYMSKIPYKINNEVLNFILENYEVLGLKKGLHPESSNYFKSTYSMKKDIITHNSLFYLQKNILGLSLFEAQFIYRN